MGAMNECTLFRKQISLREVGRVLGVSSTRVLALQNRAIAKINRLKQLQLKATSRGLEVADV